jgi:hypothetical protein
MSEPDPAFDELLAASSLGSPQAMEIRAETPTEASWRFMKKVADLGTEAAVQPDDINEAVGRVQAFVDDVLEKGWHHIGATTPWQGDLGRKTLVASDLFILLTAFAQATSVLHALQDEFGILDDGKTEPVVMSEGNMLAALKIRAVGVFAADSRRPAKLMQRKATRWHEIPGEGARDVEWQRHNTAGGSS